ncbi:MAG: hypothetical protein JWQ90_5315 [Hydrocarboniphaga sp.]|uniref:hypothetical protein n=1 Tax=Hydrocarboniphaga sp. TaxID=2033016 RepID=UPI00261D4FE7|nr:hypothetical protein [Hydrocarboniphaga sp.]MDB5972865.1 hypothetical protein [Hydrocarboniphaga sp.]
MDGRISKRMAMAGLGLLTLQACTTIQDVSESRDGERYAAGTSASARVGEVMLDRYRYSAAPTAAPVTTIPAGDGRFEVRSGYRLTARRIDGELAYCTAIDTNFACFYDNDNDGSFDHELVTNLGIASSKRPLFPAVAYTKGEGSLAKGFKSELVYLGRSDDVINLRYLDYTDDLTQPSYSQELKYTLDPKAPTEISFRDARLKVLSADNLGIRYEIQSNFSN